jgi:hypothetical protein
MNLPGAPAGSYLQGDQVFLANGQPMNQGSGPVYYVNGAYTSTNPNAATPQASYLPGSGAAPAMLAPPNISQPTLPTGPGGTYLPPEIAALQQIGQIDPMTLALAQQSGGQWAALGNKYFQNIHQTQALSNKLKAAYLQQLQNAQGGQLPPGVQREVQQQVAAQEAGTGNTAGVAQAVQQGMTTGATGYGYLQQAEGNVGNFMANNYLGNVLNQATNYLGAKGNYIAGPSTPYALGTGYVNNAINQSSAAQTGSQVPTYNPYSQGTPAFSFINPSAGNEFAQGTTGFLNAGVGATPGSPNTLGPLLGAGIGAAGSAIGGLASSGALAGIGTGLAGALAAF